MSARRLRAVVAVVAALLAGAPLRAQDTLVIHGRVIDQAGRPVESVALTLSPGLHRVTSLDRGSFEVRGLGTGVYTLTARRIGYQAASVRVFVRDAVTSVTMTLVAVPRELDSIPDTGRSIIGAVFDSIAGRPLAGAHVHLADLDRDTETDSEGTFRFGHIHAAEIDGQIADAELANTLTKDEIGLIEVFTSGAGAPLEYATSNCGVVLIWRKRFISP